MKQQLFTLLVLGILVSVLFYFGGYALLVGLGVIGLTAIIFGSFALGARWARSLMSEGARLAIESASRNDAHDAIKIKAMADLGRELVKARNQVLPAGDSYPALPPLSGVVDGSFTIAGLEDEETTNQQRTFEN